MKIYERQIDLACVSGTITFKPKHSSPSFVVGRWNLTGADRKSAEYFKNLADMGEANRNGQFGEVLSIYKSSPPELQKRKTAMILRLQAARQVGDDGEYMQSVEDCRKEYPNDPCADILSIDYFLQSVP